MYIIAADVGGTKTRLVFADADKPRCILYEARYLSAEFDGFEAMLQRFIEESRLVDARFDAASVDTLSLALPGLVSDTSARLTNLPWIIEKQSLQDRFGIENILFMNDFQASASGTHQLLEKDRIILNPAASNLSKKTDVLAENTIRVAVGAGTGLGVAWEEGTGGCQTASYSHDSEGGHIDFAPVDDTQIELLQFFLQRYGHVSYERVLSGDGLVSLYQFCTGVNNEDISAEWVSEQSQNNEEADRAMSLFVQIYGAYIGNIALMFKPLGGIFITGGIAANIVKRMQSEEFITAYLNKGRMRELVEQIAVYLVTNERVGVLGALSETIKMQHTSIQQVSS